MPGRAWGAGRVLRSWVVSILVGGVVFAAMGATAGDPVAAQAGLERLCNDEVAATWKNERGVLANLVVAYWRHHRQNAIIDPFSLTCMDNCSLATAGFELE